MSYILEALKKVEEKREREASAKLPTFSGEPAPDRKKRAVWPYFLLVALLLNAGMIIWWAVPGRPDKQQIVPPAPQIALQQPSTALPKEAENKDQDRPGNTKEMPEKKDLNKPSARVAEKAYASIPLPVPEKPSVSDRLQPAPPASQTEADKKQVPTDKVFNVNELPASIKGALPQFKVSGYAYSPEPQTRVARINDKILQEGQELAPGLKVEEIVPNGIILSYQGYRFRIGISENR